MTLKTIKLKEQLQEVQSLNEEKSTKYFYLQEKKNKLSDRQKRESTTKKY